MPRIGWVFLLFLTGCASYYGEYEREYYVDTGGSNYYNPYYNTGYGSYSGTSNANSAPAWRFRGLTTDDFYMIDNYPRDYVQSQALSGISSLNRYVIHSLFQSLPR